MHGSCRSCSRVNFCRIAKKEAKRLEKAAKLATKVKKEAVSVVATVTGEKKKPQKEKEKVEDEEPFVNTTAKGEKKGMPLF